jgi:hypothetical protein
MAPGLSTRLVVARFPMIAGFESFEHACSRVRSRWPVGVAAQRDARSRHSGVTATPQ